MKLPPIEARFFFIGLQSSAETLELIKADIKRIEKDIVKLLNDLKVRLAHSCVLGYHSAITGDRWRKVRNNGSNSHQKP